jgi:WD40 repeat protein
LIDTFSDFKGEGVFELCSLENNYLAVGCLSLSKKASKQIKILNSKTGGLLIKLKGHIADVYALADLKNQTLASGSADKTVKIWAWKSGLLLKNLTGHTGSINDVISLPNDQLASCGRSIKIWNIKTAQVIKTLKRKSVFFSTILLLNNGLHLASCSDEDEKINIWNVTSGQKIAKLIGHGDTVRCLCNLNESHLASGSKDEKIKLWDYHSRREIITLSGHGSGIKSIVLLCNGHLASASSDQTIRIWEIKNEFKQMKVLFGHENTVNCLAVLTDGNIASGSDDEKIKIWHFSPNSTFSSKTTHFILEVIIDHINKMKYILLFKIQFQTEK